MAMTKREFLNAVIETVTETEMIEWAENELNKMDAANRARREHTSPKDIEKAEADKAMADKIAEVLTTEPMTATEIGELVGAHPTKVNFIITKYMEHMVVISEVKRKGKARCKGFATI